MGTPPGWVLEHRASNPVSVKNLTAIETSTIVKLLRPYVPRRRGLMNEQMKHSILNFQSNTVYSQIMLHEISY
jgi:hypothetical protein